VNVEIAQKGEVHRDVAASLHALAGVLKAQGDLPGARRLLERSLEIKAEVYGTEVHPDVAGSLHALAGVLRGEGDVEGARRILERVLEIEAVVYGTREHFSTAITEMVLGGLLVEQGEIEAGIARLVHAHSVFLAQLGPQHPHTGEVAGMLEGLRRVR
jgi:hypothetical protein